MTDNRVVRKQRQRQPTLLDYLRDPEAYPTVRGRPYPNVSPQGAVGRAPNLQEAFTAPDDPLGPPMTEPGAYDPRVRAQSFRSVALPGAPPPEPFTPEPLPAPRGMEPLSAPAMQGGGDDLSGPWNIALARARQNIGFETNFGLASPALQAARRGFWPGRPPPPPPSAAQVLLNTVIETPPARFIREHSPPWAVAPALREADARYGVSPRSGPRRAR